MKRPGVLLLLVTLLTGSACIPEGLAFVEDDRLEITAPEGNTEVDLPLTIEWTIEDFEITGPGSPVSKDSGYFGVFVDETPQPPGKPLEWFARDDVRCENTPGCPDKTYFTDRGIHTTTDTELTIEHLPDQDTATGRETHEITIALLDGSGRRIGESAWYVTVFYQREGDE